MSEFTGPKPFVFVLMPFDEKFDDIYSLGIKDACREAGAYCERVDEQIFQDSMLERIYNQIRTADIIVSDMSGKNPNVFYETGYAHALDKQVILLTQSSEDIPFDLKHYPHIVYEGKIKTLKKELRKRVTWCIENPKMSLSSSDISIEILGNGHNLETSPTIVERDIGLKASAIGFSLQIHNIGNARIDPSSCAVGLVVSKNIFQPHPNDVVATELPPLQAYSGGAIDSARNLIEFHLSRPLLPDARETFNFYLAKYGQWRTEDATVIIYTEFGPREYGFRLECQKRE